ncbi:MAG: DUF1080 domain-containing protein [Gemmataceae bacterium]
MNNVQKASIMGAVAVAFVLGTGTAFAHEGFHLLFSSQNKTAWTTKGNWKVTDKGMVSLKPRKGERGWQRYDAYLWSEKKFENFILDLEFKIPTKGNSGVFIRVGDRKKPVTTGIEVQIYDSYGKKKKLIHHDNGGVIKTMPASKNMSKPAGEWNRMIVMCKDNHMMVKLNGEQIINIQLDEHNATKVCPPSGFIGLQDHGLPMWFRNVKIKELK